jgi:hypothetical protein
MPVFRTVKDSQKGSIRLEAVHQPLYDSTTLTASTQVQLFGQGPAGRTLLDTNLQTSGQLSWPKRFSIRAIRQVTAVGNTPFADMVSLLARAYYQVVIGEKPYLTIPAFLLSAGTGLEAQTLVGATLGTASIVANHGRPEHRNIYSLLHSVFIPPVQNFAVNLTVNTGFSPSPALKLWVVLEGELLREIQ